MTPLRTIWIVVLCTCLFGAAAACAAISAEEAAAWREDVRFLQNELPSVHPNPFHTLTRTQFDASIEQLIERLPSLSHHEIIAELAAIVASIGDGHTRLTLPLVEGSGFFAGHSQTPPPTSTAMLLHYLPIRFALCDDGLFVSEIGREHAGYLGAKVERIGTLSAEEAMQRMTRVIHHDNDMQVRSLMPSRLAIPELLHAVRITDDAARAEFSLAVASQGTRKLVLTAVPQGSVVDWVRLDALATTQPLYLQHLEQNFWFEDIAQDNVVFCQYNEVYNEEDETIADFSARLLAHMNANPQRTLVLDLRFNRGGDNSLNLSFLHALIRCTTLQEPGRFFVIIGRNTFSAAMMFALDLEKHTHAIFVGESTGARPNHYGDSRKMRLPNSGLTARISTLYWQYAGPKDDRDSVPPHIPVRFVSDDLRTGRDPAFERIVELLSAAAPHTVAERWQGRLLNYEIVVHLDRTNDALQGQIDFPGEGATGLPLTSVRYDNPTLRFDFPNGDSTIAFEGRIHDDTIIGSVTLDGRTYPWVMSASD